MMQNLDRPLLDRIDVRLAIARAIDRVMIANTLFAGRVHVADSLLPPSHWAYSPNASTTLAFDPSQKRFDPKIHLTLLTSTDRLRGTVARVIAQELALIGVDVDVMPLELGTMIARLNAGDFDLAMLQIPELTEPNVLRVFLHSSSIPPNGANRARVRDAIVDKLLDEGDAETNLDARREIYAALDRRVQEQALLIPLWHEDQIAIVSTRASSFVPSGEGRWLSLAALP
jgi:peptide/nickel transport system substrate-binding protein